MMARNAQDARDNRPTTPDRGARDSAAAQLPITQAAVSEMAGESGRHRRATETIRPFQVAQGVAAIKRAMVVVKRNGETQW